MHSVERVLVGVDAAGRPVSVDVVQRLTLRGLGDYTFAVPGPTTDVVAAPGSASEPGLRNGAILWSGFSPGRKTLVARATLQLAPAAGALPLRVTIVRDGETLTLRARNVTGFPGSLLDGPAERDATAAALDATRQTASRRPALRDIYVPVPSLPKAKPERIWAALRVTGELRFPGGRRVAVNGLLGDGGPRQLVVRVANASGEPTLRLVVRGVSPAKLLTPPGGAATWAEAARTQRVDASRLLEVASRVRLTIARALDFQTFLANPDPRGTSSATYVYESAPAVVATPVTRPGSDGRDWANAIVAALLVLGSLGLVVLWAHH
jgi:hypothetical protein